MKTISVDLAERGYNIYIGRGLINRVDELLSLHRRVLIVTDSGVPKGYAQTVASLCDEAKIITVEQGEKSKSPETFNMLCREMLDFGITRTDCIIAVGGGMVGDLTGFAAASYMRGIDFYNIPTTLLSQVDSSIGGKTAINLGGVKNVVGAFYQPKGVVIDPDLLSSLPDRQISNGMAEVIKMSLTSDAELFGMLAEDNGENDLEEIIYRALMIKKAVVEEDERESGIRRILNFGHTLGHGIEAAEEMNGLYHGECVAIGMAVCSSKEVKAEFVPVLKKYGLPYAYEGEIESALAYIKQDKKCDGKEISIVFVDRIGSFRIEKMDVDEFCNRVREEYRI